MICTLEGVELLDKATELAEMIIDSEPVENYRDCYYRLHNNKQAQQKITNFVKKKEKYDEVQRFGKYHPDYKKTMNEIWEVKRIMDLDKDVANFKKAEYDLQALLDDVSLIIGQAVSKNVKIETSNPFFEQANSCGSNCNCQTNTK